MYGMVNKALQNMVIEVHGEETWERIRTRAGVDVEVFISNEGYPDALTFQLAGAASEVLGAPVEDLLRAFGSYWILETARTGYGDLLAACGKTLPEFLLNLTNLHTGIGLIFPDLRPPEFSCSDVTSNSLRLNYRSTRQGLTPFVIGLVEGLGEMFQTPVRVQPVPGACGPGSDDFMVDWSHPQTEPVSPA